MSDLQDLIHRQAVISYEQGARTERLRILKLAKEASMTNDTGDYVYLSDLQDYIEEADNDKASK
jgi:hypothetical protein